MAEHNSPVGLHLSALRREHYPNLAAQGSTLGQEEPLRQERSEVLIADRSKSEVEISAAL